LSASIADDQHRIRENLKSIGEGHDEKRLRTTLVEKLIAQEARLETTSANQRTLTDERQRVQREIDAAVNELEFEATID